MVLHQRTKIELCRPGRAASLRQLSFLLVRVMHPKVSCTVYGAAKIQFCAVNNPKNGFYGCISVTCGLIWKKVWYRWIQRIFTSDTMDRINYWNPILGVWVPPLGSATAVGL